MLYVRAIFVGMLVGFVPLLPILAVYHFVMLKGYDKKKLRGALPHLLAGNIFCLALLSVLIATAIPSIYRLALNVTISTVVFSTIFTNSIQYINNILLFVPFGFLLPLLWKKFQKLWPTLLFGALFSLSIEAIQLLSIRITDIDDLLMNTAGTLLGYSLFWLVKKICPKILNFSVDNAGHWKW